MKKKISVQTYVKPNLVLSQIPFMMGGRGAAKKKVAQNGLKHVLILEFLRSDEICGGGGWGVVGGGSEVNKQASKAASLHTDTIVTR